MRTNARKNNKYAVLPVSGEQITSPRSGFTLIEVMIVVAIIGILTAVAIPTYQRFMIRGQVTEGLTLSTGAKSAVSEFYMSQGVWPADNDIAGIAPESQISGNYTAQIEVKNNVIEILYGIDAHDAISGGLIVLTAFDNAGSVSWSCTSAGGIKDVFLPEACR